jgi:6-pyruvoyltetrahydropterin/6-carboxytetrahydropterin synthase
MNQHRTPWPPTLSPRASLQSTKTFGHDIGLSASFRQWRAHSHCRFIHGYALGFRFVFSATDLSHEGWVVDFGGLKHLKQMLVDTFDHKLLVAEDDPALEAFKKLDDAGIADVVIVPATGCEAFATMTFHVVEQWLRDAGFSPRVALVSVEVSEHGANSAISCG